MRPHAAFLALLLTTPLVLQASPKAKGPSPKEGPAAPAPAPKGKPRVKLSTNYGPIVIELEPGLAPKTVENFLRYVREGFYAGTVFHRIIPGFMIQGGGMTENLAEKPTHAPIPNEAASALRGGLHNTRGTVAMARTPEPDSASAQFFINTTTNAFLDHRAPTVDGFGYCVFGRVVTGMDTVDKIEKVRTGWKRGMKDVPEDPVRLKSAEILP